MVLGYIANESRQFYIYVANRVQLIRSLSTPEQWRYVESEQNPADLATRGVPTNKLMESSWLKGPEFLKKPESTPKLMKRSHLVLAILKFAREFSAPKSQWIEGRNRTFGQRDSRSFLP